MPAVQQENVYKLCEQLLAHHCTTSNPGQLYAVFVSNAARAVPLWCQRAGKPEQQGLVMWDYHVLLVEQPRSCLPVRVWDLDTTLDFGCSFDAYARCALRAGTPLPPQLHRWYRVVPAAAFVQHFVSDRSHMINQRGDWNAPPPPWPCIRSSADGAAASNLFSVYLAGMNSGTAADEPQLKQPDAASMYGTVMDEASFVQHFGSSTCTSGSPAASPN